MRTVSGYLYYPDSLVESAGITYFLARGEEEHDKRLGVMGSPAGFEGRLDTGSDTHLFPLTPENAHLLRRRLPWLNPRPLGLRPTLGFGDRLGLATPGHVRAVLEAAQQGMQVAPIFAQQSPRENARTHRSPQQVLDDAMWGVFQSGWREPWGADADHLKTLADLDSFRAAGFTCFTIDLAEQVDPAAETDPLETLRDKTLRLDWPALETTLPEMQQRYLEQVFTAEAYTFSFDEAALLRILAKYGPALIFCKRMARVLDTPGTPYDLEICLDGMDTPTTPEEHFWLASELRRLGAHWVSLAPRFVGSFARGVDYTGDLAAFESHFARHAAVAQQMGGYRLSLHNGSDKFSIYPVVARLSRGMLHLKTSGTSYLEALHVIARLNPDLFSSILPLAAERYTVEQAQVRSTGHPQPDPGQLQADGLDWSHLLDLPETRQALHVTYGTVLDRFGPVITQVLRAYENEYYTALAAHFLRHLLALKGDEA